jgi:hypothetical protein
LRAGSSPALRVRDQKFYIKKIGMFYVLEIRKAGELLARKCVPKPEAPGTRIFDLLNYGLSTLSTDKTGIETKPFYF